MTRQNDKKILKDIEGYKESRWVALFEAVNLIANEADKRGVNFKEIRFKPNALYLYVNENYDIIYRKMKEETEKENSHEIYTRTHIHSKEEN